MCGVRIPEVEVLVDDDCDRRQVKPVKRKTPRMAQFYIVETRQDYQL